MNRFSILSALSLSALALMAQPSLADDEDEYIQTSRPRNLPRLLTIQTAEVLESYGVGFAGGGNIHSALKGSQDFWNGSMYVGLGDVAELGYEQENIELNDQNAMRRMRGHIKIMPVSESQYVPAMAISYGASLASKGILKKQNEAEIALERHFWLGAMSKSFQLGAMSLTIHPGVSIQQDRLIARSAEQEDDHSRRLDGQLGVTWQRDPKTMFLLEMRSLAVLQSEKLLSQTLVYEDAYQANIGVRFYLRNWLFMDAGIMNQYNLDQDQWNNGIHANFTGVIPTASLASRLSAWFE